MNKLLVCLMVMPMSVLLAEVLYSQIPDTLNAIGYRCQRDTVRMEESDIVDDITPTNGGWQIDSVTAWFHNWGGFSTWDSVSDIHIILYADVYGVPVDSPFIEIIVPQMSRQESRGA